MPPRDEIAAIISDAGGDKRGRITRLRARRLLERLENNLPFTWQPRANVSVVVKDVSIRGNAIEFVIDMTIRGVTKSLSEWVERKHSSPDWRIINPPLFAVDPTGDVEIPADDGGTRRGRDDFAVAFKQVFVDTFGAKISKMT